MVLSNKVYSTTDKRKQVYIPKSQKDFLEQHIIKKRNAEVDRLHYWTGTSKYYEKVELQTNRHNELISEDMRRSSMEALVKATEAERRKEGLLGRRARLKQLLQSEEEEWRKELDLIPKQRSDITDLRELREQFRLEKEKEQRQEAELKMLQHWRLNNPTVRQVESAKNERLVRKDLEKQMEARRAEEAQRRQQELEQQRSQQEENESRTRQLEAEEEERRHRLESWRGELARQLEELRLRQRQEAELERARQEQEEFQRRVEECEENRRRCAQQREKKELATFQKRQHGFKLKKLAEEVEKELEEDRRKVEEMIRLVEQQDRLADVEKEKCLQEVRWMQGVLKEQKAEEERRRREMELMFAEEAEKMWSKQQEIWDREEKARKRLMDEVSESWGKQTKEKLERVHREADEAVMRRHELEANVAELKRSIEDEESRRQRKREDLVEGLGAGVRERQQRERVVRFREEKEVLQGRLAELREETRLARELAAVDLDQPDHSTQDFRRRKVRWFY